MRKYAVTLLCTILSILILTGSASAHWADMAIQNCVETGLITSCDEPDAIIPAGQLAELFSKAFDIDVKSNNDTITRQELAEIIQNQLEISPEQVFKNYPDGQFHPENLLTNAEACTITIRLVKLLNQKLFDKSVEKSVQVLQDVKSQYPTGTLWGFSDTMGTNYYLDGDDTLNPISDIGNLNATILNTNTNGIVRYPTNIKYACGGFAAMISDQIFGKTGHPCREIFDNAQIHPGDIVYFTDNEGYAVHIAVIHSIFDIGARCSFRLPGPMKVNRLDGQTISKSRSIKLAKPSGYSRDMKYKSVKLASPKLA